MITAAAILYNKRIVSLPPPHRHPHLIWLLADEGNPTPIKGEQGFIDDEDNFLNRIDAGKHALSCGQLDKLNWAPQLFTEDLW